MNETIVKNTIKWIAGISFLIAGITVLSDSVFLALSWILLGCFLIPPIHQYLERKSGIIIARPVKYLIVFVGCIIIAMMGMNTMVDLPSTQNNSLGNQSDDNKTADSKTKDKQSGQYAYDGNGNLVSESREKDKRQNVAGSSSEMYVIVKSVDVFRKRFNGFMKQVESPLLIRSISVEYGKVNDSFLYTFNDNLVLVGQVNKGDQSIRSVILTGRGDGTMQSGLNLINTIGALIAATNPTLVATERGNILEELSLFDSESDKNNLKGETVRNGIQYNVFSSEYVGLMFTAQSESEEAIE